MNQFCTDEFELYEEQDEFQSWNGLRGPQGPPGIPGPGLDIAGIAPSVESLPASGSATRVWLVGTEAPYMGYIFRGGWVSIGQVGAGLVGPAGPQGPQGPQGPPGPQGPQGPGVETPVAIQDGGTGATTAAAARANIGAVSSADVKLKLLSSVADVGLTVGSATITGAFNAMPDNSVLIVNSSQFSAGETPVAGTVQIVKRGTVYAYILLFSASQSNPDYRMHVQNSAPTGTWVRLGPVVSQSTPTILSSAGTLNSGWVHRSGNVVVMSMNATVDLSTTATKIGEVPAGYRPISTVQGIALVGFNGCCYVGVSSEGNISARAAAAASSQFFRVNLSWIAE